LHQSHHIQRLPTPTPTPNINVYFFPMLLPIPDSAFSPPPPSLLHTKTPPQSHHTQLIPLNSLNSQVPHLIPFPLCTPKSLNYREIGTALFLDTITSSCRIAVWHYDSPILVLASATTTPCKKKFKLIQMSRN
jgi:hypothetical protein